MEKKIFTSKRAGTGLRPLTYMQAQAKPESAARIPPMVAAAEPAHEVTLGGRRTFGEMPVEGGDARCNLQIVLDLN